MAKAKKCKCGNAEYRNGLCGSCERGICSTCIQRVQMPYRRIVDGVIVEGCVDACHGMYLERPSNTFTWHMRREAKAIRKV